MSLNRLHSPNGFASCFLCNKVISINIINFSIDSCTFVSNDQVYRIKPMLLYNTIET